MHVVTHRCCSFFSVWNIIRVRLYRLFYICTNPNFQSKTMSEIRGPAYVLPLTEADKKYAKDTLGEDPKQVRSHLDTLKHWVRQQHYFRLCDDDDFLLMFLRQAKFSQMRVREVLERYTKNRCVPPTGDLYINKAVVDPKTLQIMKAGLGFEMPMTTPSGERVMIYRPGVVDYSKIAMLDTIRASLLCIDIMMLDPVLQVRGLHYICDFKDVGLGYFTQQTPSMVKIITSVFMNTTPLRVRSMHVVRAPLAVSGMLALAKTFLSEKLSKRIHNHWSDTETLKKIFPDVCLPNELGGTGGTFQDLTEKGVAYTLENISILDKFSSMQYDESKKTKDGGAPIGAFRKLNI